jgi:hypothetical protein
VLKSWLSATHFLEIIPGAAFSVRKAEGYLLAWCLAKYTAAAFAPNWCVAYRPSDSVLPKAFTVGVPWSNDQVDAGFSIVCLTLGLKSPLWR